MPGVPRLPPCQGPGFAPKAYWAQVKLGALPLVLLPGEGGALMEGGLQFQLYPAARPPGHVRRAGSDGDDFCPVFKGPLNVLLVN